MLQLPAAADPCTGTVLQKSYTLRSRLPSHIAAPADADKPEVPECIATRNKLQQTIATLDLPANFLDELVHELGGPGVGSQCFACIFLPIAVKP